MASPSPDWRRLVGLASIVAASFAAILAYLLGPAWLEAIASAWSPRRTLVAALVGLEYGYVATVGAAVLGVAAFGPVVLLARHRRQARHGWARAALACASMLVALVLAEGIAAGWRAWLRRTPELTTPAGDPALPGRFAESPDHDEVTITVLGESSAEGMPYNAWLSVGQIVAWQLGRAIPSRRFRVDRLARAGHTLADQYRELAGARRRPDILIVYSGHNELSAGIPWSRRAPHYLDDRAASSRTFEESAARLSPLCALIHETAERQRNATSPAFAAPPRLVDAPSYTPAEYAVRLADFRRRLEAIVAFGERIHALTVLVIPPANDAGYDPNRSFLPAATTRAERSSFPRDFLAIRRREDSDPSGAIADYRGLLERQPGFAETHYRLGRLLVRRGDWEDAYREFAAARDLDGVPMRCPTAFQQVYRDVAAGHPDGAILIDGQALFHAIGEHGLLGDDLFHDAMHPSLRGHIALSQAILAALQRRRMPGWPEGSAAPRIDPAECAAHFGLTAREWRILGERGAMFYFAVAPLRYDASERIAKRNAFLSAARRIALGEPPESVGLPNLGVPAAPPPRPDAMARATAAGAP